MGLFGSITLPSQELNEGESTYPSAASRNMSSSSSSDEQTQRLNEARQAVTSALASIGGAHDAELRTRVADIHANSSAIAKQEADLAKATAALKKESAKLQKVGDKATKQLNEIGDLQNWAEMMERDLLVVEETLRLVEGREDIESASGTGGLRP